MMFISQRVHKQILNTKEREKERAITELNMKIEKLKWDLKNKEEELEFEHSKNQKNHETFMNVSKILSNFDLVKGNSFSTIRKVKNELDSYQTD